MVCQIYASVGEAPWIRNIDLQFSERPIPNFYKLAGKSAEVDYCIKDGDTINLDETFSIKVIGTAGHSVDEVSYEVEDVMFVGDSIPVKGDIPIYVDFDASVRSLNRIREENRCKWFYPAWDTSYDYKMMLNKIDDAMKLMEEIDIVVKNVNNGTKNIQELEKQVCEVLKNPDLSSNPLFARTVMSHLNKK